jgi:hypothetical protein
MRLNWMTSSTRRSQQPGGIGEAYQVFGKDLQPLLSELNEALAA